MLLVLLLLRGLWISLISIRVSPQFLVAFVTTLVNPLTGTGNHRAALNNMKLLHVAVDGWAVTFGTARRGLGEATARPGTSALYQM